MRTVHGFGINDGKYPVADETKSISKEYATWRGFISRCYHRTENRKIAYRRYDGCSVSEFFKYYSNFYEWANKQKGFGFPDFDLDKDLLIKGNRIYSEDRCVFLPGEINRAIQANRSDRGDYPIGVRIDKRVGRFSARMRKKGVEVYIGTYSTPEEAFYNYKINKELYLKELAERWKSQIEVRAYDALINYQVEITD